MRIAFYCDLYYKSCYLKQSSVSFMIMMTMTKSDVVFVDKHSLPSYENVKLNFTLQKLFCKNISTQDVPFYLCAHRACRLLKKYDSLLVCAINWDNVWYVEKKCTVNVHYVIITYYTSLATFVFVYAAKIMIFHLKKKLF